MKFRKKPVEIEAVQYTEAVRDAHLFDAQPLPPGVYIPCRSLHPGGRKVWSADAYIDTLEGRMSVSLGDWIITGVKGEHYACKPDIFEATYEQASASPVQAEPIGAVHIDTLAMLPSLRTFDGAAKIWPASKAKFDTAYVPVYDHPPSGKDAEDSAKTLLEKAAQMVKATNLRAASVTAGTEEQIEFAVERYWKAHDELAAAVTAMTAEGSRG